MWVNRFTKDNNVDSHFKQSGRHRKTTAAEDELMYQNAVATPFTFATIIAEDYNVSPMTVRRRLKEKGLMNAIPAQQAYLTEAHKQARISFCEENMGRDWEKVLFSDEKTFRSVSDRKEKVWRPKKERYNPDYVRSVKRSGRITCGVWGFITAGGIGELCEISSHMDSEEYTHVLEDTLLPSLQSLFGESRSEFLFMQDNAGIHTSKYTKQWFSSHPEIELLKWPALSPDLNPIENLWGKMTYKWKINGLINREVILSEAQKRWDSLIGDTGYIDALYGSMPRRLQAVIDNNGNWCKY